MCKLIAKVLNFVHNVCTRFYNPIKNYVHHGKMHPFKEVEGANILKKLYGTFVPPEIELIYTLEKHNTLIIISCGIYYLYFVILY